MSARTASEADFKVDVGAVQSLAFDGFVDHPVASYLLLSFPEGKASAGRWLRGVRELVAMGPEPKRDVEAIVAFSPPSSDFESSNLHSYASRTS